jgi:hypothetical protein
VPTAAPTGTVITIGDAGKAAFVTFVKPAASAAAFHTMLYCVGEPVVAEYDKFADVEPKATEGLVPKVIDGIGTEFTVTGVDVAVPPLLAQVVTVFTITFALGVNVYVALVAPAIGE